MNTNPKTAIQTLINKVTELSLERDHWRNKALDLEEQVDEIERLRKEVEVWRKIAHMEHSAWSQCTSNCLCLSNDFRKAVRGD